MKVDYIIKNGRVVDPSRDIDEVRDVYIRYGRMWEPAEGETVECDEPMHHIDATGYVVTPGLIDYHVHCFHGGSGTTVQPDAMLSTGVTTAADAGTAGSATYESFYKNEVTHSVVRLKGYLTPFAGGQLDHGINENFDPTSWNYDHIIKDVDAFRDNIVALKIRLQYGVVPDDKGVEYIKGMISLSELLERELGVKLPVVVHTTDCPISATELSNLLRPGDVFTHCYQGKRNNIILEDGSLAPGVVNGRARGVIYDSSNGKNNYSVDVCKKALAQGFFPDVISTDITVDKFNLPPYTKSLAVVASKYISLGMDFNEVIRAITATPAKLLGLEGQAGTLAPGAFGDLVISKYRTDAEVRHLDALGTEFIGHDLLVPQMTFVAGEPVYCYTEFNL